MAVDNRALPIRDETEVVRLVQPPHLAVALSRVFDCFANGLDRCIFFSDPASARCVQTEKMYASSSPVWFLFFPSRRFAGEHAEVPP